VRFQRVLQFKFDALVVCLLLPAAAVVVNARTLEFPPADALFSITFPDDWTTEVKDPGVILAQPSAGGFAFTVFPATAGTKDREDAFKQVVKSAETRFLDVSQAEPTEHEIGGMKLYGTEATAKQKDGSEVRLTFMTFSPDGQHYFGVFTAGSEEADKNNAPACAKILKSITGLKRERGS
jgi:hypothetical protein